MKSSCLQIRRNLKGHSDFITKVIYFPPMTLISGSLDSRILVWNLLNGKCKQVFSKEHSAPVLDLAKLNDNAFLSCDGDGNIYKWRTKDVSKEDFNQVLRFKKVKLFNYHATEVRSICVVTPSNIFASCDAGGYVVICSNQMNKIIVKFREKSRYVSCIIPLKTNPDVIVFNTKDDNSVKIYDYRQKKIIKKLKGHSLPVVDMKTYLRNGEEHIITSGLDLKLNIWNLNRNVFEKQLVIRRKVNRFIIYKDEIVISGTDNGYVEGFDIIRNEKVVLCKIHDDNVCSIQWLEEKNMMFVTSGFHHVKVVQCRRELHEKEDTNPIATSSSSIVLKDMSLVFEDSVREQDEVVKRVLEILEEELSGMSELKEKVTERIKSEFHYENLFAQEEDVTDCEDETDEEDDDSEMSEEEDGDGEREM